MRIISGFYKSRLLKTPKDIRPTEDRVRKALFDILGDVSGLTVLDLFAGSGSVGLEALSQGAREVFFVEKLRQSSLSLEENIKSLGCRDHIQVIGRDAFQRHHGHGAGLLRDDGVLVRHHVHDDAALQHLRQAAFYSEAFGSFGFSGA